MNKPKAKSTPTVTVNIVSAKGTPAQIATWRKFFSKLISEVKASAHADKPKES